MLKIGLQKHLPMKNKIGEFSPIFTFPSISCVDNADGQGFSVFLAYKHTSPNVPSNRLLVKEAITQGILDAIYEDDINKVDEITKEDYDHAMSL